MKISSIYKHLLALFTLASAQAQPLFASCYAHSIFVPRQMAYNPVYEDALVFDEYAHMDRDEQQFLLSVKPIYTQTVGGTIKRYFNIDHASCMNVQENGSGDIDSLWFQVISAPDTYYSSKLSFKPVQKTYGALLYFAWKLPSDFALTINTAGIRRTNNMHINEQNIIAGETGQVTGITSVTQAFASCAMNYGRICGTQAKGGVDDIQVKLLKNFMGCDDSLFADVYALVGIPTGHGSKAKYLFEPLVGSKHAQLGLGVNAQKDFDIDMCDKFSLYGELKWRYGFKGKEVRSFDMTPNGQWSRYMLFTTPGSPTNPFPAINDLTFKTYVTPRNSFDLLVAGHIEHSDFSFELGYNFWYRQAEKVSPWICPLGEGIADLVGIAKLASSTPVVVTSSSGATISESVYANQYQMPRDASYTLVTPADINKCSGAQAASMANAVFGSIGYEYDRWNFGVNASYEHAANSNTASIVSAWANIDVRF
jgi:hypothetical protein